MQDNRVTEAKSLLNEMLEQNETLSKYNADGEEAQEGRAKLVEAIGVVLKEIDKIQ